MLFRISIIFILFWNSSLACEPNKSCQIDLRNTKALIDGINEFTNQLIQLLYTNVKLKSNVVFSPISMYIALVLLLLGSNQDTYQLLAQTLDLGNLSAQQIENGVYELLNGLEVLRTSNLDGPSYIIEELKFGLGLFLQQGHSFTQNYNDVMTKIGANHYIVNFQDPSGTTKSTIDDFINEKTGKGAPLSYDSLLDFNTILVVATTAYFRATFKSQLFDERHSFYDIFNSPDGPIIVRMMRTVATLPYYDNPQGSYTALSLPYATDDFILTILLPYQNVDPQKFISTFTVDQYATIVQSMKPTRVDAQIPTLGFGFDANVTKLLEALKLGQLSQAADLSAMVTGGSNLVVVKMVHMATFALNENGTEATQVTGLHELAAQLNGQAQNQVVLFVANHPFFAFISHTKTNLIVSSAFVRSFSLPE